MRLTILTSILGTIFLAVAGWEFATAWRTDTPQPTIYIDKIIGDFRGQQSGQPIDMNAARQGVADSTLIDPRSKVPQTLDLASNELLH